MASRDPANARWHGARRDDPARAARHVEIPGYRAGREGCIALAQSRRRYPERAACGKHALLQRGKLVDILHVLRWFHLALPETDRPSFGSRFLKSSALILAAMKSTAVNAELSDRVSSSRRPATKSWASCSISSSENWSELY